MRDKQASVRRNEVRLVSILGKWVERESVVEKWSGGEVESRTPSLVLEVPFSGSELNEM
jgi:hypothetical protein